MHHADDGHDQGLPGPHCSVVYACRPPRLGLLLMLPAGLWVVAWSRLWIWASGLRPDGPAAGRKWHNTTNAVS
jgi:hypothetical protein